MSGRLRQNSWCIAACRQRSPACDSVPLCNRGHISRVILGFIGSAFCFLTTGVMMAVFCERGRQPSCREVLHMTQMNGRRKSTISRRTDVGSACVDNRQSPSLTGLLSTHADRQAVDISVTVCNFVSLFFCLYGTDFAGDDKASGVKFCTVVHRRPGQGISHFGNFAFPEAQNRTNRIPTRK